MTDPVLSNRPEDSPAFAQACNAQSDAADPLASAWVSANAGSGKTKVLIDRVARLLLRGATPDSILCITYTKAAANEMLDRLFARLGDWSIMAEPRLREKLAQIEGRAASSYSGDEIRRARALFANALETPGGLRIETIHAFCSRVLHRFPLEAGISPGFNEIEDAEADQLRAAAMDHAILGASQRDRDRVALEAGGDGVKKPLHALFSAGNAVASFLHDAAGQLDAAIRAALGASDETAADILHKAMVDDLPRDDLRHAADSLSTGAKTDVATADILIATLNAATPDAAYAAYRPLWRTKSGSLGKRNPFTKGTGEAAPLVVDLFQMKDGLGREVARMIDTERALLAAQCAERSAALARMGQAALTRHAVLKADRAALDFEDLINRVRALLTEADMADWVLFKLDGGLTHLLLDEAQDTSPAQWEIVDALTDEFFAGEGIERGEDPRTLFVVGDEKQSIYGFQGADPDGFLAGRQAFTLKPGNPRTPEMAMSFRSTPDVLGFVDEVFNTDVFDGHPFALNPPPEADVMRHEARRADQAGRVELWPVAPKPETDDGDPWDAPVNRLSSQSPKVALAHRVAEAVRGMIDRGETVWEEGEDGTWTRRAMTAGDVMILVRGRTGGLFEATIDALKRVGLPVAGADRLVLTDHIGVQDCLNLMRFALLPSDELTLAEILRGPFCGLVDDDVHLFPLSQSPIRRQGGSLWDALSASDRPEHQRAAAMLAGVIAAQALSPFEFLSRILDRPLAPGEPVGWTHLLARLGDPARDPVNALLARALNPPGHGPHDLQHFLAAMDGDQSQIKRDLAAAGGSVRVMTVHGAKGLQAPVVILPDTTAPPKPGRLQIFDVDGVPVWSPNKALDPEPVAALRQLAADKELREHRRLLYVALTRAQDRLIIAGAWHGKADPGYAPNCWYALCEAAMNRLGAEEEASEGPFGAVRTLGAEPVTLAASDRVSVGDGAGDDGDAPGGVPDWLWSAAPEQAKDEHQPSDVPLRSISPSELADDSAPVVAPGGASARRRFQRGKLIHDLLQRLPHLPDGERDAAAARLLSNDPDLTADERAEIAGTALATLRHPDFKVLFQPSGRAEAAVIGRGRGWPPGTIINGRVDRLVVTDTEVIVADFKTDRPPPARAEQVDEAYLRQMAAYQNVLREAYRGRSVRCVLVWTHGPNLMCLPDGLLLEALNRAQSRL